jgi:hypothetical protein
VSLPCSHTCPSSSAAPPVCPHTRQQHAACHGARRLSNQAVPGTERARSAMEGTRIVESQDRGLRGV